MLDKYGVSRANKDHVQQRAQESGSVPAGPTLLLCLCRNLSTNNQPEWGSAKDVSNLKHKTERQQNFGSDHINIKQNVTFKNQ